MTKVTVNRQSMSVQELIRSWDTLKLDPGYQREGGIWTRERQQLFVDSILNGFDVPPIYLHRLRPPEFEGGKAATYAVIDGRQRLETLSRFSAGDLALARDFRLLEETDEATPPLFDDPPLPLSRYASLTIRDLRNVSPALAYRFDDYAIPVTIVETGDPEIIEELFFRLNEGVPLTPAEKRTRGALLRENILPLIQDDVFRTAQFRNRRRTYEDLLLRLLFLARENANIDRIPDLKKHALDQFAESFRPRIGQQWTQDDEDQVKLELRSLLSKVMPVLDAFNNTFEESDPLLGTVNTFMVYFLVLQEFLRRGSALPSRDDFASFAEHLKSLNGIAEDDLTEDQKQALDFAQPIQGSTTGSYFKRKASILYRYLSGDLSLP